MRQYLVSREVLMQVYVEADSEEEAVSKAAELDIDDWSREVKREGVTEEE